MKYEFLSFDAKKRKVTINSIPNWFDRLFGLKGGLFELVHRDLVIQNRFTRNRYIVWFYEDGTKFDDNGMFPELDDWLTVKYDLNLYN